MVSQPPFPIINVRDWDDYNGFDDGVYDGEDPAATITIKLGNGMAVVIDPPNNAIAIRVTPE